MKKMRKLIPAFAMLLVSAIMMSTASFAWFTMNDNVDATGMQIQAKSTGSLVIGDAPLLDGTKDTTVKLNSTATQLKPMTWLDADDENNITAGWYHPAKNFVHSITGKADALEPLQNPNAGNGGYYFDQEIYIASAGDAMTNKTLEITMTSPQHDAKDIAYNAYSAAIYVYTKEDGGNLWKDNQYPAANAEPTEIVSVKGGTIKLTGSYTIPSIVGMTDPENNTVGLKIVIRVFVDGNMKTGEKTQLTKEGFIAPTGAALTFSKAAGIVYYEKAADTDTYTVLNLNNIAEGTSMASYYVKGTVNDGEPQETYYINSANVPLAAATLSFNFRSVDAPAQGQ